MDALVFTANKSLKLVNRPKPVVLKDNDVLIKIKATGICGTDIHILKKEYAAKVGIILGHESSGIVLATGALVTNVKPKDNVILDPTYHCNLCYYCRNDLPNYCEQKGKTETGVSRDGTYAQYHVADANFIYPMPSEISFEEATLTEPLACALNALRQTRIRPEFRVLIAGAGPLGLLFGIATKSFGCEVTVGDVSDYRITKAKELFEDVQDYKTHDVLLTNSSRRFDLIVDTSGRMLESLLPLVDKGGDLLVIGLDYSFEAKIKPSYLTDNGIRIIGSIDTNLTFDPAIKMLKNNKDFKKIITHKFALTDYRKAFNILGLDLETGVRNEIQGNKVVLCPDMTTQEFAHQS